MDYNSIKSIKTELDSVDWACLDAMNANEAFEHFHSNLLETFETHCPKKEYSIRCDRIIHDPWITKGLINSIKNRRNCILSNCTPQTLLRYINTRLIEMC